MTLPLPRSLSPSKISSFTNCALAFKFSAIDRLAEPPSPAATKGTLVHRALEGLFWNHDTGRRTLAAGLHELDQAWTLMSDEPEILDLALSGLQAQAFIDDARVLIRNYFDIEDPNSIDAVGVEMSLEAQVGDIRLRGIIDRLDRIKDGQLVITDYKTGRAPSPNQENSRLAGVNFYSLLCEQVLGERPALVKLLYLRQPVIIASEPSEQTHRALSNRTTAVWSAISRACENEDFRPKTSPLCSWCGFKPYCPAFGGDPLSAPIALETRSASGATGT